MSLDGTFTCKSELERFLSRFPKLQSNPTLSAIAQKGDLLTDEEVLDSLAELFLHPNYTIPLFGCFRPLAQKIVERAVSLLRIAPVLKLNSDEVATSEVGEEEVHVIDFYIRRGRVLRLHELASLAFCRVLDLAPFLIRSVINYFSFAPPPFQRLLMRGSAKNISEQELANLLDATRVSYRFLKVDPKIFAELWDWSCFLDLVQQCHTDVYSSNDSWFLGSIIDVRWCGIQILSVILRISDRATRNFGIKADTAFACFLRWVAFCQDISIEKAGCYIEANETGNEGFLEGKMDFSPGHCIQSLNATSPLISPSHSHEIELVRRNRRRAVSYAKVIESPFVLTSSMKKSFEMVMLAVNQKWPILLHGPTGAGKTALIKRLAQVSGNQVLFLHMDEQMDAKMLIGSYMCTERPGEFKWQPGSLAQALVNGFWVVFEDIDKASPEVHSILLPLLEGASLYLSGRGEEINVGESFRLFATVSSQKQDRHHSAEGRISLSVLWRKVLVPNPSNQDMLDVVNTWYPSLQPLGEKLIVTFEKVNSLASCQFGVFRGSMPSSVKALGRFSLRDLLRWCQRIAGLGFNFSGLALTSSECRIIYQEAVDIFMASSASSATQVSKMKEIAQIWNISPSEVENLCPNKPVIKNFPTVLQIGRVTLELTPKGPRRQTRFFVDIRSSLHVLERIACSVRYNEPVLLVGETGTGKTTLVQNLAMRLGQPLTVLNLSQQSDVADLLGGFRPTDARMICIPLHNEFKDLFCKTFSAKGNDEFLRRLEVYAMKKDWKKLLHAFEKSIDLVRRQVSESGESECGTKRKRPMSEEVIHGWESFSTRLDTAHQQFGVSSSMSFTFVEGAFITALKSGHWILLDEINLAPPETLQRIVGVLEGENGTLCLAERGDVNYIDRHPHFRIFACMNPATDTGKRDLPYSIRSRFTEYFVDDILDKEELILFIGRYMEDAKRNREILEKIADFYLIAKKESDDRLQDGANQKPQFSLRSLARALEYTMKAKSVFGFERALYDGFCMFFLTLLDVPSAKRMNNMILKSLLGGKMPRDVPFDSYFKEKPKSQGISGCEAFLENYVLTESIKGHLRDLARAVFIKRYPVLLQGPTSSGKTSLVQYLAAITGHEFVRINNHDHTDLQEYFGSYITDSYGKLVFHEGVLVKAVRHGHWIVLDELNLAPSDVLEALNRLLDDNREIFIPELQETLIAHPDFMLFATQNPPTFYGGRKMLSRAFRNRFLEIHIDEIPEDELSTILEQRCKIPKTYAKKMVDIMKDLQLYRQSSKVFAGKHGFITPRDLFRWADRFRTFGTSYEDLAKDGYFLLAERLRNESEKNVVQEILEKHLRVKLMLDELYKQEMKGSISVLDTCKHAAVLEKLGNIVMTESMWRLYFLIERCYKLREPVLLVGETGGGKTTVCQLLSIVVGSRLHTVNCHMYTETSDFLGGFHPVRDRSRLAKEFKNLAEELKQSNVFLHFQGDITASSDIEHASSTLDQLNEIANNYRHGALSHPDMGKDLAVFEKMKLELMQLHQKWQTLFLWQDGPLVQAMKGGDIFLVDEISLADDSVLERLNSVLEPERKLSLAEKGGSDLEKITAHHNFFLLATMNPGGDYGKKELSPALRNRFTEIWVPPVSDLNELRSIATERLIKSEMLCVVNAMIKFWEWFNQLQTGRVLTVRDLLSWVSFINATERTLGHESALIHGAFLVLLDGLSLGTGISKQDAKGLRERCLSFLLKQIQEGSTNIIDPQFSKMESYGWGDMGRSENLLCDNSFQFEHIFGISPFYIVKGDKVCKRKGFEFFAPTTCRNALRVLRALQLPKPVLLEGSPGVGKTSLVVALAEFSGHNVVRINLSEQTDIMDLLGTDLPVEGGKGMKFAWSDGILLQALKNGSWVLLDELNLAPQSVLEGLNSILDHRSEVYIPELGQSYKCPPSFRVFACQNPSCQGGGRKGLPKSFLNRFTKVYVDELVEDDYLFICNSLYPSIPRPLLSKLICFNNRLYEDTMLLRKFGQDGSPWEFNLRDVLRSCQVIESTPDKSKVDSFLDIIYIQRMRTASDCREILKIFEEVFGIKPFINQYPHVEVNPNYVIVGNTFVKRNHYQPNKTLKSQLHILPGFCHSLEAALQCVQHQWMCILVGPSSSGKTSLIRLLAQLTGNILTELNLSSGTDISDLLGCFEQYSAYRKYHSVVAQIECCINEYSSLHLESSSEAFLVENKDLIPRWFALLSSHTSLSGFDSDFVEHWKGGSFDLLGHLVEIVEELKLKVERYQLPVSWSQTELNGILKSISELQETKRMQPFSPKFEWVAGGLFKAIERGYWVVLENANLCNPTVLDRINSLVEPGASITVNECGLVDGKPVVLHAHPNFRMFLTVNPSYGEVSRAMRNRGVEVYMMQPYFSLYDDDASYDCGEAEIRNLKRFLVLSGISIPELVDAMTKAHTYARDEGLHLGIHISLLELSRWVQLFQQLIMNGNNPTWSLQLSWEHTYLSSLGEADGRNIIQHAKVLFLSGSQPCKLDPLLECPSSLPGIWLAQLKLSDFLWYSKEACVKRNCMYLEFLGAQSASHKLIVGDVTSLGHDSISLLDESKLLRLSVIPVQMLHHIMFPTSSKWGIFKIDEFPKLDLALTDKMLFFAATWTIELANESDLPLYHFWFELYDSQLQPHCCFFSSFLTILKQEVDHPIWKFIFDCRREIISHHQIDLNVNPLPLLSLELVELSASNEASLTSRKNLYNAICSVNLLRLSFQQWNIEDEYCRREEMAQLLVYMLPMLKSLRQLEKKLLDLIVELPSFDLVVQLYSDLLEHHTWFWKGITSFGSECLYISWCSLKKDALTLQSVCPDEVHSLLVERRNLNKVPSRIFHSPKSMLWVHGGHPSMPSSADLYSKMQQFLRLFNAIWPTTLKSWKQIYSGGSEFFKIVASANSELRHLAMEGVCMASCFTTKNAQYQEDGDIILRLDEIYQMLSERFEYEKQNLKGVLLSSAKNPDAFEEKAASFCCTFFPEMLCSKPGFDNWMETLALLDCKSFSLDMELLQILTENSLVDANDLHAVLLNTRDLLKCALKFSLDFSSRPPTDFLPHQKILWLLDAWTSVDSVSIKVASFVLEMWFTWHSSMWTYYPKLLKNFLQVDGIVNQIPCVPFLPTKMSIASQILQSTFPIMDYPIHHLKLRVASCNLWQDAPSRRGIPSSLLSVARSLFQKIIFAHKKSFGEDNFGNIKSVFSSIEENSATEEKIQTLKLLIQSSSHDGLTSLVEPYIVPLLRELYFKWSTHDYLYNLGAAWLHIGGLRFHLLLNHDHPDPAMKYAFKYSRLQEKIDLLELEIKVREECDRSVGRNSATIDHKRRKDLLEQLEVEQKRLQSKITYRPDPNNFGMLKDECADFMKWVASCAELARNLELHDMNIQLMMDQACNWQETSTCFINRLSEVYAAFIDIIQPVQVAVYEMKLGLSLVVLSALQKAYLHEVDDDVDQILGTIYSFVQFVRDCPAEAVSVEPDTMQPIFQSSNLDANEKSMTMDASLLKKLLAISGNTSHDKEVPLQLNATIYHIILLRLARRVNSSMLMDDASILLLNKIFDQFARMWIDMKLHIKAKEDDEAQKYKFRPRTFRIEDILQVDLLSVGEFAPDESLSLEWQEMTKAPVEENKNVEEQWNLIPEPILRSMVQVHNQLFGSNNLNELPGTVKVNDEDVLHSFMDSYKLGIKIIEDMPSALSSTLDTNLMPESLLHLCVEYKQKFSSSQRSAHVYNIYKDSNAPALSKMVRPLTTLRDRVIFLLDEWPEHPGLQKILDVIKMLLGLSVETPLAKALLGLQFLLSRAQVLQENVSQFSFSDQLQPIFSLVSSWQKLELESWPALLDGVLEQYDANAGKLWFPLHSVLHSELSGSNYNPSTIKSLEEFVQTASVGEFKKRLELLLAFHGQFSSSMHLKADLSPQLMQSLKILYNVFGYYMQFLPLISERIETSRRSIEKELKEVSKLSQWDLRHCYLSIEDSKRIRQKLSKLIQKFNDTLQQPVMIILNQEDTQKQITVPTLLEAKPDDDANDMNKDLAPSITGVAQFSTDKRSSWYDGCRKKIDSALQYLSFGKSSKLDSPYLSFKDWKEVENAIREFLSSESANQMFQDIWISLENICRTATDCTCLWKRDTKNLKKRRVLAALLKILERCGLSGHIEAEFNSNHQLGWFLQPSYDVQHLLLPLKGSSPANPDITLCSNTHNFPNGMCNLNWEIANKYYYKNLALMQQLRQIRLNFHKDLTLEQVNRSTSFLDHLIIIQQDQRSVVYSFAEQLSKLRRCTSSLRELDQESGKECSVTTNQHAMHKCMWQQKQLFDSLCTMLSDTLLLLRTVESTHLDTCKSIKPEADNISVFIDNFISKFQKLKDALDHYLLVSDRIVITPAVCRPFVVSKQMEQLVMENFQALNDFERNFQIIYKQSFQRQSVEEPLLSRFRGIINKARVISEEFRSELEHDSSMEYISELNASFVEAYNGTIGLVMDAIGRIRLGNTGQIPPEDPLIGNIASCEVLFKSCIKDLQLNLVLDALGRTTIAAVKLVNCADICTQIQMPLEHLHQLLEILLTFGDGLLCELLAMHITIAEMTAMLASMFAALYSKGFGTAESHEDSGSAMSQDASGTGMGEGEGVNDVSDQIEDEDQLIGTSEKSGPDVSNEIPSKNGKGIEMEQDFAADTFSVSEDSGDDSDGSGEEDDEETKLDSMMGEAADNNVVDEKLWNEDEDGDPDNNVEKYESGPSVREIDPSSRELRGKVDSMDDSGELDNGESGNVSDKEENPDVNDDNENTEDMTLDKEAAFEDPSGVKLDDQKQSYEDIDMDGELADSDAMEEGSDHNKTDEDIGSDDGETDPVDDHADETNSSPVDMNSENDEPGTDSANNTNMDLTTEDKELLEPGEVNPTDNSISTSDSAQPVNNATHTADPNLAPDTRWCNSTDPKGNLFPLRGFPSSDVPEMEMTVPESSDGGKSTVDQLKDKPPEHDASSSQRTHSNPYRSLGDALEEWKERIKISADGPQEHESVVPDVLEDDNADEYEFVSDLEKGTSQALGPATVDQINKNVEDNKPDVDENNEQKQNKDGTRIEKEDSATHHISHHTATLHQKLDEQMQDRMHPNDAVMGEEFFEGDEHPGNKSGELVSFNSNSINDEILKLQNLSVMEEEQGEVKNIERISGYMEHETAVTIWRRYELKTTRLSQELAEQLRLVMEPTLASKLQGDYKTGKRINMKKVIPYIASHYRKDKIWLRRTRPNKRDYQVIVAIDDSRSMSESGCGDVAVEALVTVCRAMSQLEVGQLASVSFGSQGNVRLLQDFDQPFTGEAGIKMVSNLNFKQDNTIADQPMVNLLKELNGMLDKAVANARLSTGQNPLQQLILIIADGRFHEKESLKRCVRDVLSKKRMIAFVLLDSPKESIMDLMEITFQDGISSFSKYLNSFPFPYYIVLKNIEALPRTLADLLRQWFELMQKTGD